MSDGYHLSRQQTPIAPIIYMVIHPDATDSQFDEALRVADRYGLRVWFTQWGRTGTLTRQSS